MGSIQVSLAPNEAILDMVCSDFAIRVNVRRARGLTSSTIRLATASLSVSSHGIHTIQQPKQLRVENRRAEEPQEQES